MSSLLHTSQVDRLCRCVVGDITKYCLGCRASGGRLVRGKAIPLERSLDLVRGVFGELEDFPALQSQRSPVPVFLVSWISYMGAMTSSLLLDNAHVLGQVVIHVKLVTGRVEKSNSSHFEFGVRLMICGM